jgi:beta-lactam-binding protein with PASTA domain
VHGINEETAIAQLEAAGLKAGRRSSAVDRLPAGYLISTEPRAGDWVTRGSTIDYVVSEGRSARPTKSPGRTFGPAGSEASPGQQGPDESTEAPPPTERAPAEPDPTAAATSAADDPMSTPVGSVLEMAVTESPAMAAATETPREGSPDRRSSPPEPTRAAHVRPSSAPSSSPSPFPSNQMAMVGDFLCLDLATARAQIEEAGLLIGVTIPSDSEPADDWIVHGQLPKAGESVPVGSNVDLVLMDPMDPCPLG